MRREDDKPWYRQFWPWFIIALPAASVVGGLSTVWIAMQTTDSLVIQSDDGVQAAAARGIVAESEARRLELGARFEIDVETGAIRVVLDRGRRDALPAQLHLEMTHPAFADSDLEIALNRAMNDADDNPVYAGHVATVPKGKRYLVLRNGNAWRLSAIWRGESELSLPQADGDGGS